MLTYYDKRADLILLHVGQSPSTPSSTCSRTCRDWEEYSGVLLCLVVSHGGLTVSLGVLWYLMVSYVVSWCLIEFMSYVVSWCLIESHGV